MGWVLKIGIIDGWRAYARSVLLFGPPSVISLCMPLRAIPSLLSSTALPVLSSPVACLLFPSSHLRQSHPSFFTSPFYLLLDMAIPGICSITNIWSAPMMSLYSHQIGTTAVPRLDQGCPAPVLLGLTVRLSNGNPVWITPPHPD
jgi:hypothetical protein